MTSYKCESCGSEMEYSYSDRQGDHWKCTNDKCDNTGMYTASETPGSPVDESAFGF